MSKAAIVYYIAAGVFNFGGKDYKHGEALPAELPAETVARMIAKGTASETRPVVGGGAGAGELGTLRDQVKSITAQLAALKQDASDEIEYLRGDLKRANEAASKGNVEIGRLQDSLAEVAGQRDAARDSLDQAQTTIREMSAAQLTVSAAPPVPPAAPLQGAGPKK